MSTEENKEIVRRHVDAVNKKNPAVWDEIMSSDYVLRNPQIPPGRDGYKAVMAMFWNAFPDVQVTIEDLIGAGDKLVIRYTERGTHQGELLGIAPAGKRYTKTGIAIYRIDDGQMVEGWFEEDWLGWMQQVGAIPAIGQATG